MRNKVNGSYLYVTPQNSIVNRSFNVAVCWVLIFSIIFTSTAQAVPIATRFRDIFVHDPNESVRISFPCAPTESPLAVAFSEVRNRLNQRVLDGEQYIDINGVRIRRIGINESDLEFQMRIFNMDLLLQEIWGPGARNPHRELVLMTKPSSNEKLWFLLTDPSEQCRSLYEYVDSEEYRSVNYFDQISFQRHFLSSLLINPRDAHLEKFAVDSSKRLWAVGAYERIGIPFERTQEERNNYQFATCNALYVSELDRLRTTRIDGQFMSDQQLLDEVVRPFHVRDPRDILLGWLMNETVRKHVYIEGNNSLYFSMLNHFIEAANQISHHSRPNILLRDLVQTVQTKTFDTYAHLSRRFPDGLFQERDNIVRAYTSLRSNPQQYAECNDLDVYNPYRFYTILSGSQAFEILLRQLFVSLTSDPDRVDTNLVASIAHIINSAALTYENRYGADRPLNLTIDHLNNEDRAVLRKGLFRLLKSGLTLPQSFLFAVRLGFPINEPGESGYTLLHEAVRQGDTQMLDALYAINQGNLGITLDTERLSSGRDPQTALDLAIGRDEVMFQRLLQIGAGSRLQKPREALEAYLTLKGEGLFGRPEGLFLKNAFKTLAQRHQEFRWLVVLEEVFPKVRETRQELPSFDLMEQEITQHIIQNGWAGEDQEDISRYEEELRREDISQARRQQLRKRKLNLILQAIRNNGIDVRVRHLESCVAAAANLRLEEGPEDLTLEENTELGRVRDSINEHIIKCFNPYERKTYNDYRDRESFQHLVPAMKLTAVQRILRSRGREDIQSLSAYIAAPLLAAYLKILDRRNRTQANEDTYRTFMEAFDRNSHTRQHEENILDILNNKIGNNIGPVGLLERTLHDAYLRIMRRDTIIDMAENGLRLFRPEVRLSLLPGGIFPRANDSGLCAVRPIGLTQLGEESLLGEEGVLFIKKYPQIPGLEAAVSKLVLGIARSGVPYSDLVSIENVPYLISQGFGGANSQNVFERLRAENGTENVARDLEKLDPIRTSFLVLSSILVSPEDGKYDNFVFSPVEGNHNRLELVSVDNDHAFVDPVGSERARLATGEKKRVQTNTFIFALKEIMRAPIPREVKEAILNINPESFLSNWLLNLHGLDEAYNRLFPDDNKRKAIRQEFLSCIGVPLSEHMIMGVYDRLVFMQEQLIKSKDLTPAELLSRTIPVLTAPSRYGKFLTSEAAPDLVLTDSTIRQMTTSKTTSYYTSNRLFMENFVDDPLDDRLRKARETMDRMTATIQSIEEIVANPALKTPASLELFKHSQYQKKRFLTGFNFADFSTNDQRSILHILMDPNHPTNWLELKNCSVLGNDDFYTEDDHNGDDHNFILKNLIHLSVEGCQNLTPRMINNFLTQAPNLRFLDISCTHCDIGYDNQPVHMDNESSSLDGERDSRDRENHLRTSLRVLKMNGLIPDRPREIKISGPKLQKLEIDGMVSPGSELKLDAPVLEYLSLRNMTSLNDRTLDQLLFYASNNLTEGFKADLPTWTGVKTFSQRFPELKELYISGTSVTLSKLRELLPELNSEKVLSIQARIQRATEDNPEAVLQQLRVNINHILSAGDFFNHTGLFIGNVLSGLWWDVWGLIGFVQKMQDARSRRAEIAQRSLSEVDNPELSKTEFLSGVGNATSLALRVIDTPFAVFRAVAPVVSTTATVVPIVGWAISATFWTGRAAYWEHLRVQRNIQLAQLVTGMALRSAIEVLYDENQENRLIRELSLQDRFLGDTGLSQLFVEERNRGEIYPQRK